MLEDGSAKEHGITGEDVYNAYTGDGGLHGLERGDYDNYHQYSQAKKETENGQFFTPPDICRLIVDSLNLDAHDLVADLTCGMGNFFNFMPEESNIYGCEIDPKAYKVARFLYPDAKLSLCDIRTYEPGMRFDYVVGNPPCYCTNPIKAPKRHTPPKKRRARNRQIYCRTDNHAHAGPLGAATVKIKRQHGKYGCHTCR